MLCRSYLVRLAVDDRNDTREDAAGGCWSAAIKKRVCDAGLVLTTSASSALVQLETSVIGRGRGRQVQYGVLGPARQAHLVAAPKRFAQHEPALGHPAVGQRDPVGAFFSRIEGRNDAAVQVQVHPLPEGAATGEHVKPTLLRAVDRGVEGVLELLRAVRPRKVTKGRALCGVFLHLFGSSCCLEGAFLPVFFSTAAALKYEFSFYIIKQKNDKMKITLRRSRPGLCR